jgi:hypothetical protein
VLDSKSFAVRRRINACARPGCIPLIGGFCAPRNPCCLETAYPTIQHAIGQTRAPTTAGTIVGSELSVAASGIAEPELNAAVSTIVEREPAGAAFSRHGDLPGVCLSDLRPRMPLARPVGRPYRKASLQFARR